MSQLPEALSALAPAELRAAYESFASIADSLLEGYNALAERAELVEHELARTNRELELKVAELDAVKRRLEAVLQALPCGVVVRAADGSISRVNQAALHILGLDEQRLLADGAHKHLAGAQADGVPREIPCAGGGRLVLATRWSPVPGPDGGTDGGVEVLDDRTELSALTERLQAMDRVAALGTMAGGIAHEIRNPMNAIMGFAGLLKQTLTDERSRRWAGLIVEGCRETDSIITSLLTLAQPEQLHCEDVAPRALLEDAVAAALRGRSEPESTDGRWHIETLSSAPSIRADRIKLRQALRNLIANALDALPAGGKIRLTADIEGGALVVRVGDSGPGLPHDQRQRVFDPFYTTRPEGVGLGLALVAALVRAHGGSVRAGRSALGGAEFTVRIPCTEAPRAQ